MPPVYVNAAADGYHIRDGHHRVAAARFRCSAVLGGERMSEAEVEFVVYYGGASPGDGNFADIVAIDGEIVEVLAERERRKKKQSD